MAELRKLTKDKGSYIENACIALLGILFQVVQEISTAKHIQIHSNLVQKKHLEGAKQTNTQLYPSALAIGNLRA